MVPPPESVVSPVNTRSVKFAPALRMTAPELSNAPPMNSCVLFPIEMVPALAPAPVPPLAENVPLVMESVAIEESWMLATASPVLTVTVKGVAPAASRIASSPAPGIWFGVQSPVV